MIVLGIESSCDETAAAVVSDGGVLSNLVATQHDVHAKFGGVVPELASRRHMENIIPLIRGSLAEAKLDISDIEGVAVTFAPGLLGSLLVGISAAKGISYSRGIPIIGVNHLEGHLNAASLETDKIKTPYVGMIVSGGHTSLYLVEEFGRYELLGATRDDAAGEAFDKVAKLLGLGYPGGPAVSKAAEKGNPKAFRFSSPKFSDESSLDFSFSGIKTAVMLLVKKLGAEGNLDEQSIFDISASFQESVVKLLVSRLVDAATQRDTRSIVLAGGVAANSRLREHLRHEAKRAGIPCHIPSHNLCTDNAAMIAHVGRMRLMAGERSDFALNAVANLEIGV